MKHLASLLFLMNPGTFAGNGSAKAAAISHYALCPAIFTGDWR